MKLNQTLRLVKQQSKKAICKARDNICTPEAKV